jgi:hemin uptake protein HemP
MFAFSRRFHLRMVRICVTVLSMSTLPEPAHDECTGPAAHGTPSRGAQVQPPIKSEALFRGAAEVQIEHRGSVYRLRKTSLGKLILTK